MRNFVQPGNTITLTAPYAVASGDDLLVGSIFGVVTGTAKETTKTTISNTLIGVAVAIVAGGAGDTISRVRLNASF